MGTFKYYVTPEGGRGGQPECYAPIYCKWRESVTNGEGPGGRGSKIGH